MPSQTETTPWVTDYPTLSPSQSLLQAVAVVSAGGHQAFPVVEDGQLVGAVLGERLVALLASQAGQDGPVGCVGVWDVPPLPEAFGYRGLAMVHARYPKIVACPVVGLAGEYRGMIFPQALLAGQTEASRPARVGGMATPLGVYLHCRTHSGGAGGWALVLGGAHLALLLVTSYLLLYVIGWFLEDHTRLSLLPQLNELAGGPPALTFARRPPLALWPYLPFAFVFLTVLRTSQVSQYHAAEHMTVHTLESFEELTIENVRRKPRAHGRCGSNLMALVLAVSTAGPAMVLSGWLGRCVLAVGLVAFIRTWRFWGRLVQNTFTTRQPEDHHLQSALRAARQLLHNFHQNPTRRANLFTTTWHAGLLQSLAGLLGFYFLLGALWHLVGRTGLL